MKIKTYKNLDVLIGVSKERLKLMIEMLLPKYQEFISKKFDSNYCRIPDVTWSDEEKRIFYQIIRKRLKNLANRDLNLGHHLRDSFLTITKISKEEFWNNFHRLALDVQEFTISHFNEDLTLKSNYDYWPEEDKNYYQNRFKDHIKLVINENSTRNYHSLPKKFNISKEEFDKIFPYLSKKSQEIIRNCYDENYKPIISIKWEHNDRRYLYNYTYHKIRKMIVTGPLKKEQITYGNLLEKHNITKSQMRYIKKKFNSKYNDFIESHYNTDYKLYLDFNLTKEEIQFLGTRLTPKIKKLVKLYQMDIINEEAKELEKQTKLERDLYESFDPLSNLILQKNNSSNMSLEKIYEFKSYYKYCYDYLKNIKEDTIKLTLKKD